MDSPNIRPEERSADSSNPTCFNIAGSFPVTDKLVRRVERQRRRRLINLVIRGEPLQMAVAVLIGYSAVAYLLRR